VIGSTLHLTGKVAIVTGGGGGGSGRSISRRLAREGARLVVADIREAGGEETVRQVEAEGGRAAFFQIDVGDEARVRSLFGFAADRFGGVDLLINNASVAVFPETSEEHWFANVRVDLIGAMYATRYGIEAMRRGAGGAIVNIGSTSALRHGGRASKAPGYDAAKAGIIRLTTCLAPLAEREGIRVNCLVPDWIATDQVTSAIAAMTPDERREWRVPDVLITLEEVAGAVLRLATDEALAGRVMVWWCGEEPRLISQDDRGYAAVD
jgi:NAD(P)-dependent dehydrogenase (short-subunit alcohol dehydrogenase family)